eukprot:Clim_evm6s34 gene=Clim_evmTU6s34
MRGSKSIAALVWRLPTFGAKAESTLMRTQRTTADIYTTSGPWKSSADIRGRSPPNPEQFQLKRYAKIPLWQKSSKGIRKRRQKQLEITANRSLAQQVQAHSKKRPCALCGTDLHSITPAQPSFWTPLSPLEAIHSRSQRLPGTANVWECCRECHGYASLSVTSRGMHFYLSGEGRQALSPWRGGGLSSIRSSSFKDSDSWRRLAPPALVQSKSQMLPHWVGHHEVMGPRQCGECHKRTMAAIQVPPRGIAAVARKITASSSSSSSSMTASATRSEEDLSSKSAPASASASAATSAPGGFVNERGQEVDATDMITAALTGDDRAYGYTTTTEPILNGDDVWNVVRHADNMFNPLTYLCESCCYRNEIIRSTLWESDCALCEKPNSSLSVHYGQIEAKLVEGIDEEGMVRIEEPRTDAQLNAAAQTLHNSGGGRKVTQKATPSSSDAPSAMHSGTDATQSSVSDQVQSVAEAALRSLVRERYMSSTRPQLVEVISMAEDQQGRTAATVELDTICVSCQRQAGGCRICGNEAKRVLNLSARSLQKELRDELLRINDFPSEESNGDPHHLQNSHVHEHVHDHNQNHGDHICEPCYTLQERRLQACTSCGVSHMIKYYYTPKLSSLPQDFISRLQLTPSRDQNARYPICGDCGRAAMGVMKTCFGCGIDTTAHVQIKQEHALAALTRLGWLTPVDFRLNLERAIAKNDYVIQTTKNKATGQTTNTLSLAFCKECSRSIDAVVAASDIANQ